MLRRSSSPARWPSRAAMLLAAMAASLGTAARATPPDALDVRDTLFGSAPCCVLVLRSTQDNLGQYYAEQRDVVLVVIDRATGAERQYPVYRARGEADFDKDEAGDLRFYTADPLPGSADPFALLAGMRGMPLTGGGEPAPDDWHTGAVTEAGDTITIRFEDATTLRAALPDLRRQADASLARTAEVLGDYQRIAPISTADLLAGRATGAENCRVASARRIDDRSGNPPVVMLRVACNEDAAEQITSLLVPLGIGAEAAEVGEAGSGDGPASKTASHLSVGTAADESHPEYEDQSQNN